MGLAYVLTADIIQSSQMMDRHEAQNEGMRIPVRNGAGGNDW